MLVNILSCSAIVFLICSLFRNFSYFFVVFFATIVLNLEILSIWKAITPTNILILQFLELGIIFLVHKFSKKNVYLPSFHKIKNKIFFAIKSDKLLFIMAIAWSIMIFFALYYSFTFPIMRGDDLAYHCYRPIIYFQQQSIVPFDSADERNIILPINSEIIYTWLYSFNKDYTIFRTVQFFSFIAGICSLFSLMELFKVSARRILWTIFVLSSIVKFQLQIWGTETDIIVGSLSLTAIFLLFKFLRVPKFQFLLFSSLALALSIGVKTTAFVSTFVIFFTFFVIFIKNNKIKEYFIFLLCFIFNFLIFSSFIYFSNFYLFGNFLTNEAMYTFNYLWGGYKAYIANLVRYFFDLFDCSGTIFYEEFNNFIKLLETKILNSLNISDKIGIIVVFIDKNFQNTNGFGINGFFGIVLSSFISITLLLNKQKSKLKKLYIYSSFIWVLSIIIFAGLLAYMEPNKRYLVAFLFMAAPFLGIFYTKKNTILKIIIFVCCVYYFIFFSIPYSETKKIESFKKKSQKLENIAMNTFNQNDKIAIVEIPLNLKTELANITTIKEAKFEEILLYKTSNEYLKSLDYLIVKSENPYIQHIKYFDKIKKVENFEKNFDCKYHYIKFSNNYNNVEIIEMNRYIQSNNKINFLGIICDIKTDYIKDNGFVLLDEIKEPYYIKIFKNSNKQ